MILSDVLLLAISQLKHRKWWRHKLGHICRILIYTYHILVLIL